MLLIADSCLLRPWFNWILEKLLTPFPPTQFHVVFHASVDPLKLTRLEHCEPDVAPPAPHKSASSEYEPAGTTSQSPQCCDVSMDWRASRSEVGAATARVDARRIRVVSLSRAISRR